MSRSEVGALLRIEELAEAAGTTVRNIRVYQERGLLPAPARRGRTAYYGPEHRSRLALILRLLDRGYTFATIEELLIAERHGLTLTELLAVETVRSERRTTSGRRKSSRGGADPVADFALPEELLDRGSEIGLVRDQTSADHFLADDHMYELFRELLVLGVDEEGVDRIGSMFMEGQRTAAEVVEILVQTMRGAGMGQAVIEKRVNGILPRAGLAARLIFLSAARTLLAERHGFPRD